MERKLSMGRFYDTTILTIVSAFQQPIYGFLPVSGEKTLLPWLLS